MKFQNIHRLLTEEFYKIWLNVFILKQLAKFSLVGILNTIIGYGSFIIFLDYYNYMWALIISHIIGVTHSYLWNKFWTFKSDKNPKSEFLKFYSIYFIALIINALMLVLWVNILNFDPRMGQLIALPIITITCFTGHKYWSFN